MKTPAGEGGREMGELHTVLEYLQQKGTELLDVGKIVRVGFFQLLNGGHFNQYNLAILPTSVFFLSPDIGRVCFLVFAGCVIAYGGYFFGGIENEQDMTTLMFVF